MEKRLFRIIALDLDGTLLDSSGHIPRKNYDALMKAYEMGAYIVPSTGRLYATLPDEVRDLPCVRFVIEANGAQIYDAYEKRSVAEELLYPADYDPVYDYLDSIDCIYDCYMKGVPYVERSFYDMAEVYCSAGYGAPFFRKTRTCVDGFRDFIHGQGVGLQKISAFFKDRDSKYPVIEELKRRFPNQYISTSVPNNVEINAGTATKGHALLTLCKHLGFDPSETIAFGDEANDVPALISAGVGVAMANAVKRVIEASDIVTLSNDECGVAHTLNELMF